MPDVPAPIPLPPGSTIGILGAGQLGRMLALAAARLGFKCHIFCEDFGPAMDVAAARSIAAYGDFTALERFAAGIGAATYEFENVPLATARHLAKFVPLRPGANALEAAQDRLTEKRFISALGIPVAPFEQVDDAETLNRILSDASRPELGSEWSKPSILKTRRLGYDGKGQVAISPASDAHAAFASIGGQPAVLELRIGFEREVSVLLVRGADGAMDAYDSPANTHRGGILAKSAVPSGLEPAAAAAAVALAKRIAGALGYVGLLTVELFDLGPTMPLENRFVVNEIAPRVHNSGHWTLEACAISQFENHIRAVAGWPLGSCVRHADAEMENLIGDRVYDWQQLAAEPNAALHLYGKREARPGRKMGHLTRLRPLSR